MTTRPPGPTSRQSRRYRPSAHGVRADGQKPDAAEVLALPLEVGRQGVGEGRDELEALDAFAPDEIGQRCRVEQDRTGASDERSAGGQGADPVAGEDVEGEAGGLEVSERRPAEVVGVLPGGGGGEEAAVGDHDALGPPGAAGGKDDVGEVLAVDAHPGVLRLDSRERFGERIEGDDQAAGIPEAGRADGPRSPARSPRNPRSIATSRSAGWSVSSGKYAPPAFRTPSRPTILRRPPVEVEAHDGLRPHAELDQAMGQRIG